MDYLPVFINLRQKPCLVVGGGDIALRKVNLLLKAQAKIKCISPEFCSGLIDISRKNTLDLIEKRFESTDIDNQSVIIAATDDNKINAMVSSLAQEYLSMSLILQIYLALLCRLLWIDLPS